MMLYKNMKVNVRSLDEDTDFFDIVADVLQRDTLALYLFIICLDYILLTSIDLMKENGFTLEKVRSWWYLAQTLMDADYEDDIALLANTPTKAYSLLPILELAAGGIGLYVNADEMELMCFNQSKMRHLNTKWYFSETCRQVHLPRKQCLIYRKWHQYATSEGMDCYWEVIGHMEVRPIQ